MSRRRSAPRIRPIWIVLGMTAALLALLAGMQGPADRWLAAQTSEKISTAPDEEAVGLLRRLAGLEEAGLPGLTEALASARPLVARTAAELLRNELAEWELLPTQTASPRMALLAESLADRAGRYSPESRREAAACMHRILDWPGGYAGVAPGRIVAACARTQAALDQAEREQRDWQYAARFDNERIATWQEAHRGPLRDDDPSTERAVLAAHEHPLSGDENLPEFPDPPVGEAASQAQRPGSHQSVTTAHAAVRSGGRERVRSHTADDEARPLAVDVSDARPLMPHEEDGPPSRRVQPLSWERVAVDDSKTDTVVLLRLLGGDDEAAVRRAEAELTARGFTGVRLELARRLTDRDPAVRRRWAAALPGQRELNAKPWLLMLAEDDDAEVRLTAVSLMVTTGDPELLRAVERVARDDADPRIQRVASQLVEQRQGGKLR